MDDDTKLELAEQEHEEWTYWCEGPGDAPECNNCRNLRDCQPVINHAPSCNEYKKESTS